MNAPVKLHGLFALRRSNETATGVAACLPEEAQITHPADLPMGRWQLIDLDHSEKARGFALGVNEIAPDGVTADAFGGLVLVRDATAAGPQAETLDEAIPLSVMGYQFGNHLEQLRERWEKRDQQERESQARKAQEEEVLASWADVIATFGQFEDMQFQNRHGLTKERASVRLLNRGNLGGSYATLERLDDQQIRVCYSPFNGLVFATAAGAWAAKKVRARLPFGLTVNPDSGRLEAVAQRDCVPQALLMLAAVEDQPGHEKLDRGMYAINTVLRRLDEKAMALLRRMATSGDRLVRIGHGSYHVGEYRVQKADGTRLATKPGDGRVAEMRGKSVIVADRPFTRDGGDQYLDLTDLGRALATEDYDQALAALAALAASETRAK